MIELFAIFDSAAVRFIEPFPASTVQVAIRGFQEACSKEGHQFEKFPEDYTLFHVGTFDPEKGEIESWSDLRKVAMATSFVHDHGSPKIATSGVNLDLEREA